MISLHRLLRLLFPPLHLTHIYQLQRCWRNRASCFCCAVCVACRSCCAFVSSGGEWSWCCKSNLLSSIYLVSVKMKKIMHATCLWFPPGWSSDGWDQLRSNNSNNGTPAVERTRQQPNRVNLKLHLTLNGGAVCVNLLIDMSGLHDTMPWDAHNTQPAQHANNYILLYTVILAACHCHIARSIDRQDIARKLPPDGGLFAWQEESNIMPHAFKQAMKQWWWN